MIVQETETREECGSCGADLSPSTVYLWHHAREDCRAIKQPLNREVVSAQEVALRDVERGR